MQSVTVENPNEQVEILIRRWGGSVSEIALNPSFHFFSDPGIEGVIGYRLDGDTAITFGDPNCSIENTYQLAQAFCLYCQRRKLNIIFMIVSEGFAKWAIKQFCHVMIEVGEELVFDPQFSPLEGHSGYRLRNKIHHAQNAGLSVHEYLTCDTKLENEIKAVGIAWLNARRRLQIHLGALDFFERAEGKRLFYLKDEKQVIGAALLSRLEGKNGWLLKFLVTQPNAPRGSSELLMSTILQTLKNENCQYLTYGIVPADQLGEIIGLSKFSQWLMKKIFGAVKWVFHLDQRKIYWSKYRPKTQRSFTLFTKKNVGIKDVRTILRALKVNP